MSLTELQPKFRNGKGSAPASGAVFRALAENPVALKRSRHSCQSRAQCAGREARPATPGAGVLPNFGIRVFSIRPDWICFAVILVLTLPAAVAAAQPAIDPAHSKQMAQGLALFQETIRPALLTHCVKCHGGEKTKADFNLTSRESLLKGYSDGPAIIAGNGKASRLFEVISHADEPHMPADSDQLPGNLIAEFARWIDLGAPYDRPLIDPATIAKGKEPMRVTEKDRQFWSFQPLGKIVPPKTRSTDLIKNDLDRFVFSTLETKGLKPASPADKRTLIRRAFFDLIGLPPTPAEVDAFVADNDPRAYEKLVDGLLKSPHYGERWARHWLDAARFAESHGFEQDYDRPFAYHYRDFVIKALNADMPYDQFVKWQLAGDEFAPDEPLALMATGFMGAGVFPTQLTEKEFESARYDELDDMAATTGTAMLGLTIGCARCHDHKFDPIPTRDYYRFVSTFTTTIRSEIDLDLEPQSNTGKLAVWQAKHDALMAKRENYERIQLEEKFASWLMTGGSGTAPQGTWQILDYSSAVSERGSTLTKLADGSVLVSGKNPQHDKYVFVTHTDSQNIRALRVEALTHSSMPGKGPGRADNGNFALVDLKVYARRDGEAVEKKQWQKFRVARVTHEQNQGGLSARASFDENTTGSGWAVDGGGIGKAQAAVFEFAKPVGFPEGTMLEVIMTFGANVRHNLGRPRLSITTETNAPARIGDGVSQHLAEAFEKMRAGRSAELSAEQRATLFRDFAKRDAHWATMDAVVQKSMEQKPAKELKKVQVTSEGFKPTKHHADGRGFPHFYPKTYFLNRGDVNQKQDAVSPGFLQVLMRDQKTEQHWQISPPSGWRTSYRRRSLANWITDTEHGAGHLLARVIVNRLWHHHLGHGIVATPNDFGFQGARPTHPELLDYLANQLIKNGWRLNAIHKLIMTSATYRQSSDFVSANAKADPENQYFWRYDPHRLEAESIRDSMLAISGQLDRTMFGPGTLDEKQRRRSIYFMIKRSKMVPMMQLFDMPEPLVSQGNRPATTVAPQALMFMNNPQVRLYAEGLAKKIESNDLAAAVRNGFRAVLGREPMVDEVSDNVRFLKEQTASYTGGNARQLALADFSQVLMSLNEFVYVQ